MIFLNLVKVFSIAVFEHHVINIEEPKLLYNLLLIIIVYARRVYTTGQGYLEGVAR